MSISKDDILNAIAEMSVMDVAEELDRLNSHVSETRKILKKGGAQGRRLDFMMQEFNREANTLGSKSINTDVTASAVELKVLIEQMREFVLTLNIYRGRYGYHSFSSWWR
jgi:uncharacterized protein (TIGR00255 family)